MSINSARIAADIEAVAQCSECAATVGYSRPTFSPQWAAARDYLIDQARKAGCQIRVDAAGNVHARPACYTWDQPLWLSGSHVDSVPTGGKYDGVMGVVAPLEVLRAYPNAPLELVIFAEEEGTTFNLGMLGSRAWTGTLDAVQLAAVRNKLGQNYLEAGANFGVDAQRLAVDCIRPPCYRGLIELHAEQGLSLWNSQQSVAVVTGINGRRQFFVTVQGIPNHAGSTHMPQRRDALTGAAEMISALERLGNQLHQQLPASVITVGWIACEPNGLNIIPGTVRFSVDFRASLDAMLEQGETQLRSVISEIAERRELGWQIDLTELLPAMPLDQGVCQCIRNAAAKRGIALAEASSGALHDAAIIAPFVPTAMIFVASRDGISHNPAEFSRLEDIAVAAQLLADVVLS